MNDPIFSFGGENSIEFVRFRDLFPGLPDHEHAFRGLLYELVFRCGHAPEQFGK